MTPEAQRDPFEDVPEMPRHVTIYIGNPEHAEVDPTTKHMLSADDAFTLEFVEANDAGGFVAQADCLCSLKDAAQSWLMGNAEREVKKTMVEFIHDHNE